MDKVKYRTVIKYFVLKGLMNRNKKLDSTLDESLSSWNFLLLKNDCWI